MDEGIQPTKTQEREELRSREQDGCHRDKRQTREHGGQRRASTSEAEASQAAQRHGGDADQRPWIAVHGRGGEKDAEGKPGPTAGATEPDQCG